MIFLAARISNNLKDANLNLLMRSAFFPYAHHILWTAQFCAQHDLRGQNTTQNTWLSAIYFAQGASTFYCRQTLL